MVSQKIIKQNCHILNQIKPCDNLILKSKFFDPKLKLSQGLILVQREPIPVWYDKRVKGFKEKDAVQNAWEKVAKSFDFVENSNFIRASSN